MIVRLPSSDSTRALASPVASVVTALTTTMSPVVTGRDAEEAYVSAAAAVAFAGTDDAMAYVSATTGAVLSTVNVAFVADALAFNATSVPVIVTVAVPLPVPTVYA